MKLTSAATGVRAGVRTLARDSVLLRCPGAPGCTIGAFWAEGFGCWAIAVAALRQSSTPGRERTQGAMRHYTTGAFAGSIGNTAGPGCESARGGLAPYVCIRHRRSAASLQD